MDEGQLRLFRRSGATWQEATCSGYTVQRLTSENLIVVPICQTGTFALADQAPSADGGYNAFLPLLIR